MRKVTSTVIYKVPSWDYCNMSTVLGSVTQQTCRFCAKSGPRSRTCLITNDVLAMNGDIIYKTHTCRLNSAGFEQEPIEDCDDQVDVDLIVKATMKAYDKKLKSLVDRGYSIDISMQVAREVLKK